MKCFVTNFDIRLDMDPITYGIALQVLKKTSPFLADMSENTCLITKSEELESLADLAHNLRLLVVVLEEIDGLAKTTYESLKDIRNPFDIPEKKPN